MQLGKKKKKKKKTTAENKNATMQSKTQLSNAKRNYGHHKYIQTR